MSKILHSFETDDGVVELVRRQFLSEDRERTDTDKGRGLMIRYHSSQKKGLEGTAERASWYLTDEQMTSILAGITRKEDFDFVKKTLDPVVKPEAATDAYRTIINYYAARK